HGLWASLREDDDNQPDVEDVEDEGTDETRAIANSIKDVLAKCRTRTAVIEQRCTLTVAESLPNPGEPRALGLGAFAVIVNENRFAGTLSMPLGEFWSYAESLGLSVAPTVVGGGREGLTPVLYAKSACGF